MRNFGTFRRIPARRPQTVPRRTAQMIAIKQQQDREPPVFVAVRDRDGFFLRDSDGYILRVRY